MIKKLFGIALFTFVIGAYSSVEDSLLETPVGPIEEPGLIAYPRKNNLGNMTRSESMALDWESLGNCHFSFRSISSSSLGGD